MFDDKSAVTRAREAMRSAGFSAQEIMRIVAFRRDLRDEMAIAAMQAIVNAANIKDCPVEPNIVAQRAYRYADAMLEVREEK